MNTNHTTTNAAQITLRETILNASLSLSAAERTAMELEYLLNGYNGINAEAGSDGGEIKRPPGICESAHDLSCRIQRLSELLETVRGMLSHDAHSGHNMGGQALGSLARPMGFADLRDETLRGS